MANKIELKSISELSGMIFFIPSYQRGYRWTEQQVKDLLDDIHEFINGRKEGFYCIQPLVVKKEIPAEKKEEFKEKLTTITDNEDVLQEAENIISRYTKWEVIDGQQRLTTIYILLSHLGRSGHYQIEYETRTDSKAFLEKMNIAIENPNIDYHHMIEAKKQIEHWFADKDFETENDRKRFEDTFCENLLANVKFIWYESINENPISVFTRLNIGKISLTNAELIKALFLNKSNFSSSNYSKVRLQQQKIAGEWENIEYTLQNDEFWLFLNSPEYKKPTRIDFIFDLMCEKNTLYLTKDEKEEIGTDEYKTFRYFYTWFRKQTREGNKNFIATCWEDIKGFFQIFQEWYNDLELYHYIGYLLAEVNENSVPTIKISTLIEEWKKETETKKDFIEKYLIGEIKNTLIHCRNLDKEYEIKNSPKTQCRPILLLHNIQSVINQNKNQKESEKYKLSVFYKFPFHLFKQEKWDVEHIDSNTENTLGKLEDKKEWLRASYIGIADKKLQKDIEFFLSCKDEKDNTFDKLQERIINDSNSKKLSDGEKNQLRNFTLLDASTNRSYGNSIFSVKRRAIISKDQGKTFVVNENLEIEEKDGSIAFVPPCTKHVFLKYFNHSTNNLREWDEDDAKAYLNNIRTVLSVFLEEKEA